MSWRYGHRGVRSALGILQGKLHKSRDLERACLSVGLKILHLGGEQPLEIAEIACETIQLLCTALCLYFF